MNAMIWLAAMIILIVIEIVTVGLTTIWFAIGALVAIFCIFAGWRVAFASCGVFGSFIWNVGFHKTFCH